MIFAGLVCYAKYLETSQDRLSISFGVVAAVAALTKATGFILAGVPPFGVLPTRRFRLLRNPFFWAAAAIVVVLAGPWYYLAPGATHESALPATRVLRTSRNLGGLLPWSFHTVAGTAVIPFSVIGLVACLVTPLLKRERIRGIWAASGASIISMLLMLAFVSPSRAPRHLIIILSPVLLFTVAGVVWVVSMKPLQNPVAQVEDCNSGLDSCSPFPFKLSSDTRKGIYRICARRQADYLCPAIQPVRHPGLFRRIWRRYVHFRVRRQGHGTAGALCDTRHQGDFTSVLVRP